MGLIDFLTQRDPIQAFCLASKAATAGNNEKALRHLDDAIRRGSGEARAFAGFIHAGATSWKYAAEFLQEAWELRNDQKAWQVTNYGATQMFSVPVATVEVDKEFGVKVEACCVKRSGIVALLSALYRRAGNTDALADLVEEAMDDLDPDTAALGRHQAIMDARNPETILDLTADMKPLDDMTGANIIRRGRAQAELGHKEVGMKTILTVARPGQKRTEAIRVAAKYEAAKIARTAGLVGKEVARDLLGEVVAAKPRYRDAADILKPNVTTGANRRVVDYGE